MTKPAQDELARTAKLDMRISPKLLYLAKLAARFQGQTLSQFVERAIIAALDPAQVIAANEAGTGEYPDSPPAPILWSESLWSEDEAERLYSLAMLPSLLSEHPQARLWSRISAEITAKKQKLTLKTFSEHYYALQGEKKGKK